MKVLVAGGAGYIGSHTCKALAEAGHTPIVYDNLCTGHAWAVKWGPLERGDLNDAVTLDAVLKRHRPQAVIDIAGLIDVGESNREPVEDMRQEPINPYGRTKLMSEMILRDACAAYGMAAVALRYFNASGADASGESGEEHDPETHLIPLVLQAAAGTRANITVFGNDYDTPDRTCIRDYVHVSDLASAHVAALGACVPGKFAAYNLGTGRGVSITEVIELARRITGRPIAVSTAPRRAGDPPMLFADASLASRELRWTPAHSDPANIVQTAWTWMIEHRRRVIGAG